MRQSAPAGLPISDELLSACLERVFGTGVDLRGWTALGGGTRKTVDRLETSGGSAVLLTWGNRPDFFGEQATTDPRREANDYVKNTRYLLENGVRAPRILYYDAAHGDSPCPYALVETIEGQTFDEAVTAGQAAGSVLAKMRAALERMHDLRRERAGMLIDEEGSVPVHEDAYSNALEELADLAAERPEMGAHQAAIAQKLETLAQDIQPRDDFRFIHGELGPDDHILIEQDGEVVLLDVDNCCFHDLEREHAYLRLRFGGHYPALARPDLDPARMALYGLCMHLSSAWGHHRLLASGFPDPERLRQIYEWNAARAIELGI